jgi:DHA2 family multidrug resistance protein
MAQAFVEDPPYLKRARERIARIDFSGFALLAVWLGTLQIVLDKGQQEDWFASDWLRWFAVISVLSFFAFVVRELRSAHPIVDLHVLRNRNFGFGVFLITTLGAVLYGTTAALPIFLQTLMGYPALESGLALSPRGIGAFVTTFIVGRLVGRVRNRILISLGFLLLAVSSFWLGHINLQVSLWDIILPSILNGVAISFIFTPLTTAAVGHLQQDQIGNATGIYNLMRNLGGSFGIALVTTLLARRAQVHQALMVSHLTPFDPVYTERLAVITQALSKEAGPVLAQDQAHSLIYGALQNQASLWAFVENFRLFGGLCLACVPLAWFFKQVKRRGGAAGGGH